MTKKIIRPANSNCLGVCAAFANYFDIDVTLIRLGVIFLALFTGIIIVAASYVVAAMVIPSEGN